jgi:hypothetical protein
MTRSRCLATLGDWLWFLVCAGLSTWWCVSAAAELGATFDEPIDLNNGLEFWRTGSHYPLLKMGAMPLPMDLASLPAYLWERSTGERVDFRQGAPYTALFAARVALLPFWWLLLIYARLVGRLLAGPWAGRLAVAILAAEPTVLAHAALATKDLAITACMVAFVYHFRVGREGSWLRRIGWPAFWYAAALLSKASAIVFAPLCMFAIELERLARAGALAPAAQGRWLAHAWEQLRPLRRDALHTLGLGTVLVFVYCGSDFQPQQSCLRWAYSLPEGPFASTMVWTFEHLRIFSNAGEGVCRQISHNIRGHGAYLLGHADSVAMWYYFPVALSIKLSPLLLALPLVLALLRPRSLSNWACLAAGMLLLYSLQCRVQIGVRLMLPLVAIGAAGLAAACVRVWRELGPGLRQGLLSAGLVGGLSWSAASAVTVWPHGLCYVNELYGGTHDGYRCVSDSNYDWGQGLKDLARWQQQHRGGLDVWYFGTDPAITTMPVRRMFFQDMALKTPHEVEAAMRGRRLAVSFTLVYGSFPELTPISEYLRHCPPLDRTPTFLIYDFTQPTQFSRRACSPPGDASREQARRLNDGTD